MTVGMLSYTRVSRMSTHYNLSPDMFVNWVGFTPEWATVHTHQQSTLCMKGVWCRSGGVPLTAHCSLHCTTEKSVGPQADGERGHSVFLCLPGRLCQVPTPPHCHTVPFPQLPSRGCLLPSSCECKGHSVVHLCLPREGWEVRVSIHDGVK